MLAATQLVKWKLLVHLLEEEGYLTVEHWLGHRTAEGEIALTTMLNSSRNSVTTNSGQDGKGAPEVTC